jgi:hypothetical protein
MAVVVCFGWEDCVFVLNSHWDCTIFRKVSLFSLIAGRGRSQWRLGGSKWSPGGSVEQWSQIRITFRIRIRIKVKRLIRIRLVDQLQVFPEVRQAGYATLQIHEKNYLKSHGTFPLNRFLERALALNQKYHGARSLKVAVSFHLVARTQSCMGDFRYIQLSVLRIRDVCPGS